MSHAVLAGLVSVALGAPLVATMMQATEQRSLSPGVLTSEFVYDSAPFPSAPASTIVEAKGERLQALGRTRSGRVFKTWSEDSGRTWTPTTLTGLPNSSIGTDAQTLKDGRHLLVYNHTPKGRTPLNVAVSRDGKTWEAAAVLENEPGEYSYPFVIQTSDGRVHITYTWRRLRIKHVVIDPARLKPVGMSGGAWPAEPE